MASGGGFRGTSAGQDVRFSNKDRKLMKSMKFPKELDVKVDMKKINMDVMKPWIAKRVTDLLGGLEDEVLIGLIYNQLEQKDVEPKMMQINLTGFLEKNTSLFMKELWTLLASAQETQGGVPRQFLEEEEERLRKVKEQQEKLAAELKRQREAAQAEAAKFKGDGEESKRSSRWDSGKQNSQVSPRGRGDRSAPESPRQGRVHGSPARDRRRGHRDSPRRRSRTPPNRGGDHRGLHSTQRRPYSPDRRRRSPARESYRRERTPPGPPPLARNSSPVQHRSSPNGHRRLRTPPGPPPLPRASSPSRGRRSSHSPGVDRRRTPPNRPSTPRDNRRHYSCSPDRRRQPTPKSPSRRDGKADLPPRPRSPSPALEVQGPTSEQHRGHANKRSLSRDSSPERSGLLSHGENVSKEERKRLKKEKKRLKKEKKERKRKEKEQGKKSGHAGGHSDDESGDEARQENSADELEELRRKALAAMKERTA